MKKLFVSQPMNGKSSDEILKKRTLAKSWRRWIRFLRMPRRMQSRCGIWENR